MNIEVRQMWRHGPLRQFSERPRRPRNASAAWEPYQSRLLKGWAGPYVCHHCRKITVGVYRDREQWLCALCMKLTRRNQRVQWIAA